MDFWVKGFRGIFIRLKFIIMVHNLILNLRTNGTASLSHELFLIIAFGELLIKKVHVRFILCSSEKQRRMRFVIV
ncbi:hypothetical protein SD074_18430 [Prolixibacter sp. SD074]|nr:hypothetical protein SD074_18430 [Prolixibacter sp. SD074]